MGKNWAASFSLKVAEAYIIVPSLGNSIEICFCFTSLHFPLDFQSRFYVSIANGGISQDRGQRRFEPTATVYGTYFMKTMQIGSKFQTIMMFLIGNIGQSVAAVNTEYILLMGREMICFKPRL